VPLFVFEPRYRQMTRDALRAQQIGMVTVRPDNISDGGDPRSSGRLPRRIARPGGDGTFIPRR
jgi:Lon protease-like protein